MSYPNKAMRLDAALKQSIEVSTETAIETAIEAVDTSVLLAEVEAIADPTTATAEDVATKVNEILTALKGA